LMVDILISFFGVYETSENKVSDYIVGLINGFLIFCTAGGATEFTGNKTGSTPAATARGAKSAVNPQPDNIKRRFFSSWFE